MKRLIALLIALHRFAADWWRRRERRLLEADIEDLEDLRAMYRTKASAVSYEITRLRARLK